MNRSGSPGDPGFACSLRISAHTPQVRPCPRIANHDERTELCQISVSWKTYLNRCSRWLISQCPSDPPIGLHLSLTSDEGCSETKSDRDDGSLSLVCHTTSYWTVTIPSTASDDWDICSTYSDLSASKAWNIFLVSVPDEIGLNSRLQSWLDGVELALQSIVLGHKEYNKRSVMNEHKAKTKRFIKDKRFNGGCVTCRLRGKVCPSLP